MSYTKADQIEFTFRNYLQRMAPSIDESRVRNAFMAYACINKVTTKEFQESTWEDIVNRIMQKYDM